MNRTDPPFDSCRTLLATKMRPHQQLPVFGPYAMGIKPVLSAPRSPWQRAYVERLIGTIRRECLDHVIVFSQRSLCHHLRAFCDYYCRSRTHLALQKDSPEPRSVEPPDTGRIISIPQIGSLHHRYEPRAA